MSNTLRSLKHRYLQARGVSYVGIHILEKDLPEVLRYSENPDLLAIMQSWEEEKERLAGEGVK